MEREEEPEEREGKEEPHEVGLSDVEAAVEEEEVASALSGGDELVGLSLHLPRKVEHELEREGEKNKLEKLGLPEEELGEGKAFSSDGIAGVRR